MNMKRYAAVQKAWKAVASAMAALCLTAVASNASALPFASPIGSPDIDGTGYFDTGALGTLAVELFDLADSTSTFGFFEQGAPGTLVPIFEAADLANEVAIVDFNAGFVFDQEDNAIQNVFAAPTSSIGFYLATLGTVLYSDPTLNLGGLDLMGAFQAAPNDFLNVLFYDGQADGPNNLLSWHVLSDITPAGTPVPVPASTLLVLAGLGALASRRRAVR